MYLQGREKKSIFDVRRHFKPTDTFQYTQFSSCHPRERLYERRSLRLLVTNSSKTTFEENITLFKQRLRNRGYPDKLLGKNLSWPVNIILQSLFYFNDLAQAVNPRDIPVVTVRDFTKFHIPPPLSFEFEKISRISPYPGAENLIHPLYSPTYFPGWPRVIPLGEADDMCIIPIRYSLCKVKSLHHFTILVETVNQQMHEDCVKRENYQRIQQKFCL